MGTLIRFIGWLPWCSTSSPQSMQVSTQFTRQQLVALWKVFNTIHWMVAMVQHQQRPHILKSYQFGHCQLLAHNSSSEQSEDSSGEWSKSNRIVCSWLALMTAKSHYSYSTSVLIKMYPRSSDHSCACWLAVGSNCKNEEESIL